MKHYYIAFLITSSLFGMLPDVNSQETILPQSKQSVQDMDISFRSHLRQAVQNKNTYLFRATIEQWIQNNPSDFVQLVKGYKQEFFYVENLIYNVVNPIVSNQISPVKKTRSYHSKTHYPDYAHIYQDVLVHYADLLAQHGLKPLSKPPTPAPTVTDEDQDDEDLYSRVQDLSTGKKLAILVGATSLVTYASTKLYRWAKPQKPKNENEEQESNS